jgi:hypothetical protein
VPSREEAKEAIRQLQMNFRLELSWVLEFLCLEFLELS